MFFLDFVSREETEDDHLLAIFYRINYLKRE